MLLSTRILTQWSRGSPHLVGLTGPAANLSMGLYKQLIFTTFSNSCECLDGPPGHMSERLPHI